MLDFWIVRLSSVPWSAGIMIAGGFTSRHKDKYCVEWALCHIWGSIVYQWSFVHIHSMSNQWCKHILGHFYLAADLHIYVQTKNVSGRLLVGLRWWNEVTDDGGNWRFESLTEVWCAAASSPLHVIQTSPPFAQAKHKDASQTTVFKKSVQYTDDEMLQAHQEDSQNCRARDWSTRRTLPAFGGRCTWWWASDACQDLYLSKHNLLQRKRSNDRTPNDRNPTIEHPTTLVTLFLVVQIGGNAESEAILAYHLGHCSLLLG